MANHLLYFPYINLPKNEWTIRSLIYYDTISSIVPDEYFYNPKENFEPYMLELIRENLVIPLNPMHALDNPYALVEPFLNFIDRPNYNIQKKRERFNKEHYNINAQKFASSSINGQKFNSQLLFQLAERGLARHSDGYWYEVENFTAGYLMSYLSNILAKKLDLLPATDEKLVPGLSRIYHNRRVGNITDDRREKVLKGIIPYPLDLDIGKLFRLKDKYGHLLSHFKSIIEQIALDSKYNDEQLLSEKIVELNFHKDEISARITENRFGPIVYGTVFGLAGAVYGYAQTNSWAGAIGGFPGFANAVYSALKIEDPIKQHDYSGMKYLSIIESKSRTD